MNESVGDSCFQVEVVEGELECPDTHKIYPISSTVPNMLLNEDEVE